MDTAMLCDKCLSRPKVHTKRINQKWPICQLLVTGYFLLAVLLPPVVKASSCFMLTLLHTNDVHSRFEEYTERGARCEADDDCYGGVARRMTKIKEIRDKDPNVILVDSGDQFQGTAWFTEHAGKAASHFMNKLGYDAMAIGIHEFDRGIRGLTTFLQNVSFPVVSANINISQEPSLLGEFNKSTILTIGHDKIGVIGYTSTAAPNISLTGRLIFEDVKMSLQGEVQRLENEGVNKIIALGNAGIDVDLDIARNVEGVDIVVGGLTNTFLYTGEPPGTEVPYGDYPQAITKANGDPVLVVQDYAFGKYLGYLKVIFDRYGIIQSWKGNPVLLNATVEKDPAIEAEVFRWGEKVQELYKETVGLSQVVLDGTLESCRLKECSMGNLISDAAIYRHLQMATSRSWGGVGIALVNGGSIWASIEPGNITRGDLMNVQPFGNTLDMIEILGQYILAALEHSVAGYDPNLQSGKFLQMSGIKVKYDLSKPDGFKVCEVQILCTDCLIPEYVDLDLEKIYKVVMPSFLVRGGDGYSFIPKNLCKHHFYEDLDVDVLVAYIQKTSPIIAGLDGRIQFARPGEYCSFGGVLGLHSYSMIYTLPLTLTFFLFMVHLH